MSGSGLIYGAIVVMWAAVLVPMWLRRHEDADEQFTTAMRVLARRRGAHEDQPPGDEAEPGMAGRGRASVVMRRRRMLAALVALTFVLVVAALAGLAAWTVVVVSLAALSAYVVHLRRQVLAEASARRRPLQPAHEVACTRSTMPVAETGLTGGVAVSAPAGAGDPAWQEAESSWEPVRIPPPTYTTKPPAPSPARRIDLSRPGFWAEGWQVVAQASSDADGFSEHGDEWHIGADGRVTRSGDDELFDQEAPEHRRAVGD